MLKGKTVVLGVTGSIAAYKSVEIARELIKQEARVKVIMTDAATHFVNPLTFETITGQPVITSLFRPEFRGKIHHISLAEEADLILVAPATANILAKAAHGIADDMLSTTLLSATCTIIFAPAMNTRMYLNPVTQENIKLLKKRGFRIIEPERGGLACGEEDLGRLASIDKIVDTVKSELIKEMDLQGKIIIVTAGGTQEPFDPIRYIGNRSSGKMGYAIAEAAWGRGAHVILISAPTQLEPPRGIETIHIRTAMEMQEAVLKYFDRADAVIKTAAVTDFRPTVFHPHKIKRDRQRITLELEGNPDILEELGKRKRNQILIGFAAESENLVENAKQKLKKKNLDFIVANDITKVGSGFEEDVNEVIIIDAEGKVESFPPLFKGKIAEMVIDRLITLLKSRA
ncbi:MAG: bifunctional phosphopantothenoylcysteine decarboxylase/phosphopantothenate--cysteine ligase CoaBC [Actinomycetota bacterium]|nr:bifunctional phosphopantothenoylcysteine decarboxylase/phosphopantothenate--cysteine ligase CoaBC [Actinomycetota bacterium]